MSVKDWRQKQIVELIQDIGCIPSVNHLAQHFGVSPFTIYRDLGELKEELFQYRLEELHDMVLDRIVERLNNGWNPMRDRDLLRLLEFFQPRRGEAKIEMVDNAEYKIIISRPSELEETA